jgi:hypothetical protein
MKTPMQQMLELLEELLDSKPTRADRTRFETAISKAKELIKEEKEVIDDAYLCGLNRGVSFQQSQEMGVICEWPSDRDYYKETFNTK